MSGDNQPVCHPDGRANQFGLRFLDCGCVGEPSHSPCPVPSAATSAVENTPCGVECPTVGSETGEISLPRPVREQSVTRTERTMSDQQGNVPEEPGFPTQPVSPPQPQPYPVSPPPLPPENVPTSIQYVQQVAAPKPPRGMSIGGMVLGIVAWAIAVLSFFLLSPLSLLLSIIGLPLSIFGLRKEPSGRGMAITGIVLNSIGVALGVIMTIITIVSLVSGSSTS